VLIEQIRALQAGGGTAIPRGLSAGLAQLASASGGRVRRVVLASDGLDSTRQEAERLAASSFERGITVSSMGIGLDFDESYMGGVARAGHGNFAFVKDGARLAGFLERELVETATTTIENAAVRLQLPSSLRFVRAFGADLRSSSGDVDLAVGSLFAGDERRIVVELEASAPAGVSVSIGGAASWNRVGGGHFDVATGALAIVATHEAAAVQSGKDGRVLASASSVTASTMELEAAEAYERGDTARAQTLIDKSIADLQAAAASAPAPAATALHRQWSVYQTRKPAMARPATTAGSAAAKRAFQDDSSNLGRAASF
jgi:Ca-activated chloride channel family protein